ncbi:MAG: LytR family transcriptional regulator [Armatimonadetes bacterium]|nr:MAG: LytR family transcriptional regulator [Armatimonadota bacterium]
MMDEIKALKKIKNRKSLRFLKKSWLFLAALVVSVILLLGWAQSTSPSVFQYVFGQGVNLNVDNGRLNVLLLGIAGGKHDGPNLTDTVIVASYDVETRELVLISLPRDLWLEEHKSKINVLYHTALNKGEGLQFVRSEIAELLGIDIPYAVRVDFAGFTNAIDLLEGIDVQVEKSFDDYVYPIPGKENELCGYKEEEQEINEEKARELGVEQGRLKVLLNPEGEIATASAKPGENIGYTDQQVFKLFPCRFEHLRFEQGVVNMDGETALKFVRSRHGTNMEGTDFARSKRQQLVIQAVRNKVLSLETLTDPKRIVELVQTFGSSFETDISQSQYIEFAKLVKKVNSIKSYVIDGSGQNPLLISPPSGKYGAWVLVPAEGDFSRIQQFVQDVFWGNPEASGSGVKY